MRVLLVNSVCGIGSTGRICAQLASALTERGDSCKIAYGRSAAVPKDCSEFAMRIGTKKDVAEHIVETRLFDNHGFASKKATEKWLREVQNFNPDIIHLHNIHGYYVNIEMLFSYIKSCGKPVVWTLHDCWSFTGHCAHYDNVGCTKWHDGCFDCQQKRQYPASFFKDASKENYKKKKDLFLSAPDLTLVTPSHWLSEQVKQSFLKERTVKVIPNGIDLDVFHPCKSDLRLKYGLKNKKIVLSVSNVWDELKGLDTMIKLANSLPEEYKVVLIGLTGEQATHIPPNIICIEHTESQQELAKWYSAADVFVNASVQETMGLTSVEAAACGAPIVVPDATALPEVASALGGAVVKPNDMDSLISAVKYLSNESRKDEHAADKFSLKNMTESYLNLYDEVLKTKSKVLMQR